MLRFILSRVFSQFKRTIHLTIVAHLLTILCLSLLYYSISQVSNLCQLPLFLSLPVAFKILYNMAFFFFFTNSFVWFVAENILPFLILGEKTMSGNTDALPDSPSMTSVILHSSELPFFSPISLMIPFLVGYSSSSCFQSCIIIPPLLCLNTVPQKAIFYHYNDHVITSYS